MAFDFSIFNSTGMKLNEDYVYWLTGEQYLTRAVHYERLWSYYQNDLLPARLSAGSNSDRPYVQTQEYGLPVRVTGVRRSFWGTVQTGSDNTEIRRKEIVIENDIAWRIETIVDFLFGRKFTITSKLPDRKRAQEIEAILNNVFECNGGILFFQQLALLGSVYGFVDVIVRTDELFETGLADAEGFGPEAIATVAGKAGKIILEAIEPVRSLPVLNENNYRKIDYYIQYYYKRHNELSDERSSLLSADSRQLRESRCLEVISPDCWQRYQEDELVGQGVNPLGCLPVVHIQNMAIPYQYEGRSDVEPLIPLQDELNTRLSDRASRITLQSFKMYLGKGIDNFNKLPVGPGVMWNTSNPDAKIDEFGGDDGSPAESEHIQQIRDALEKSSGVAAIAAGIIRNRIGNLTSAVALKITLMGILAKNQRKRQCYGKGIADMSRLILLALDKSGVFPNSPQEREIEIHWPNPLPENITEILQEAKLKQELGVPAEQVLKEIGY